MNLKSGAININVANGGIKLTLDNPTAIKTMMEIDAAFSGLNVTAWVKGGMLTIAGTIADVETVDRMKMRGFVPTKCKPLEVHRHFEDDYGKNTYRFS